MRPRVLFILLATAGFAHSSAFPDWASIAPRPFENGAYFDVFASYERDDNPGTAGSLEWDDTFIREKLTVFSNGYFYHPRFLLYQLSLAGALKQEDYRSSFLEPIGWQQSSGVEYEARLFLLPEHPYNLELFALRYEPLYKEQAATNHNSLQTNWGGLFRYRKKPGFFSARFNDSTTQTGVTSSNVRRYGVDGEYFKRYVSGNQFSLNAAYNPSRFTDSLGLEGKATEYLFGNLLDFRRVRLNSSLTKNDSNQESGFSGRFESNQFAWYELLNVYLPLNFRTDVSYRYQDNQSTIPIGNSPQSDTLSDLSRIFELDVVHRLFQSLDSTYTFLDNSRTSTGGDTDFRSNYLTLSYTKTIPEGRVLAGVSGGRGVTDNQGQADVVGEPHPALPVPGFFVLAQQDADPLSIVLFLRSPLPPFNLVRLQENVHYTVTPSANTFQINVLTLPPAFVVPGTYDFTVSYSLSTGEFKLRSDSLGYNASVELMNTMLTPYYSYVEVRSDVLSGVFPGSPPDSTTRTAGIRFHRGPLRALGEYQVFQWDISPYRAWRTEVQYIGDISPTARIYATGSYLDKYYWHGSSSNSTEPYTDETASATGSFQKQLLDRSMALSAGGSYTHFQGQVNGNAYSLNSSLSWKIGKLDLTAGASAYNSDTHGTTGVLTSRLHSYYYINLRRSFF